MALSLVDLCIKKWIDNVWSLGDVGELDDYLLNLMLPLCSVDQLKYVEGCTKILQGNDLSSVTDKLWKTFYEKRFGNTNTDEVIDKMRSNNLPFKWKQAYEYKEEETKVQEQMRRLALEDYNSRYRGTGYYGWNPMAREEIDSLNSEEDFEDDYDEEAGEGEEEDYYNGYDDVGETDEESDAERRFRERVVDVSEESVGDEQTHTEDAGEVEEETDFEESVEEEEEQFHFEDSDLEEFMERVVRVQNSYEEEDEETDFEEAMEEEEEQVHSQENGMEELFERVVEVQGSVEEDDEGIHVEEGEHILIEDDRNETKVGQEEGYRYDGDSHGNDYYDDGHGHGDDDGWDNGYFDDYGYGDDGYECDWDYDGGDDCNEYYY